MSFPSRIKTYLDHSSIHGFPHITNQNKSLAERGFWAVICSSACYATWVLLQIALHSYEHSAVSFIVDPNYLNFNTTFPSLSICQTDYNFELIKEAGDRIYGPDRDMNINMFVRQIAYYDGTCATCSSQCKDLLNCSGDLGYITKMTRSPCSYLITNCSWNGQPFDCCSYFLPLQTEFGECFSINSANTVPPQQKTPKLHYSLNKTMGPVKLEFSTKEKLNLYLHSIDDVPTINHPKLEKISAGHEDHVSEYRWDFKILEIHNDPLLKSLPIRQRECRFPEEKFLQSNDTYSYSGCMVQCRGQHQNQLCNCTHHLMPKISGMKTCDLNGIVCLSKHLSKLRNPLCNCTTSCVEPDFHIISFRKIGKQDRKNNRTVDDYRRIVVRLLGHSSQRLVRIVVRTKLDLVVSMGSIHGLRYITEPGRHFTERVFWGGVCSLAVYFTYYLLMASWYSFQHNAVNFGVETAYLDWNTTFPSITICEHEAPDKIFDAGTTLYGEGRNMNLDFFVRDIAFFDGTCNSCTAHCGTTVNCTDDFNRIVVQVRAPCDDLMGDCAWGGVAFNCCLHFLPVKTEIGTCFSLNSKHTTPIEGVEELHLISNKQTGPGKIELSVFEAIKLFVHSPEDVPNLNHPQEEKVILNWGVVFDMVLHVVEIENDPSLNEVSVRQRNCRFPDENILQTHNYYSYSACVVDCRIKFGIKMCNCTHHHMPELHGVKTCGIEGLACLTKYADQLRTLKPRGSSKKGLECDCMSSCTEPEYTIISKKTVASDEVEGSVISVSMDNLPALRFKRNVVRTKLDLVVSMGGTAGLFLGASILSTAEWVYYMFIRKRTPRRENTTFGNGAIQSSTRTSYKTDVASKLISRSRNLARKSPGTRFKSQNTPAIRFMR
ncbi:hypothetical protein GE061_005131 [Apolygus lucorum]|uniref:Uncharacterized protein n=1 Tax=Apolygus lucorum TaxID=248454 RepID=A0A8S9WVF0_APOLU|nr:hypothetical protein GE061_005131 [Apolygus lucorum]